MQSLDPATKYVMLDPPPASKTHSRSLSDGTLQGRLENQPLSILEETIPRPSTPDYKCPGSASEDRKDSRNGISGKSSVYSRDTNCSAAADNPYAPVSEDSEDIFHGRPDSGAPQTALSQIPESTETPAPSMMDPSQPSEVDGNKFAESPGTESKPSSLDIKTYSPMRKVSALSIGPISVQNVQFYSESRPGTMLNEDPEQHRPRVHSVPNSEVWSSEEGSPQVSPMTIALRVPPAGHSHEEDLTPDSDLAELDLAELDLGSPSFSASTASSDGQESPLRLSPQNSIKKNSRPASRSGGGGFTGFANRLRSIRTRQHPPILRRKTEQAPATLEPPAFMNYILPTHAIGSNHSLAKTRSNPSAHARSANHHLPAPSVFNNEIPLPTHEEASIADSIFSELGYLSASIG